ncbi:hypothetical protein BGU93_19385 [Clostridioides difficile]|nr:hypothetical protein BGU93_19385 [Clostridioides difficile]
MMRTRPAGDTMRGAWAAVDVYKWQEYAEAVRERRSALPDIPRKLRKGCPPVLSAERAGGDVCQPRKAPCSTERGLYQ